MFRYVRQSEKRINTITILSLFYHSTRDTVNVYGIFTQDWQVRWDRHLTREVFLLTNHKIVTYSCIALAWVHWQVKRYTVIFVAVLFVVLQWLFCFHGDTNSWLNNIINIKVFVCSKPFLSCDIDNNSLTSCFLMQTTGSDITDIRKAMWLKRLDLHGWQFDDMH